MKPPADKLSALRRDIDRIDDAIHDLLMRRAKVVAEVRKAKGRGGAVFQPAREAAILARLAARHRGALSMNTIAAVWRRIINAHTALQQPIEVAVAALPAALGELAVNHFAGIGRIVPVGDAEAVWHRVAAGGRATLGVVGWPGRAGGTWWAQLGAGGIHVIGALPALGRAPDALVIARQVPIAGPEDRGLVVVAGSADATALVRAARAAGLSPRGIVARRAGAAPLALIELNRYVAPADERLAALAGSLGLGKGAVRCAGGFAVPLALTASSRRAAARR
ncbi:MAG: chorismate mutase [Alphaproteobacteria bacterium]|nr:chorismate mutase [Alphaproteobacteria bacterium]